jgi:hypothetical protein
MRIRIHMFLGLLDPDPDPLVRASEVWILIQILLSLSKYSKKNLDFYCFVTFLTFYLDCNSTFTK